MLTPLIYLPSSCHLTDGMNVMTLGNVLFFFSYFDVYISQPLVSKSREEVA